LRTFINASVGCCGCITASTFTSVTEKPLCAQAQSEAIIPKIQQKVSARRSCVVSADHRIEETDEHLASQGLVNLSLRLLLLAVFLAIHYLQGRTNLIA
jgi:hypothetical protein